MAGHDKSKARLEYRPRPQFAPFHDRDQRFSVIVAHRRAGKTVACINDLIAAAITERQENARFGYLAPTYRQAKDVAWEYLKRFARPVLAGPPNETELRVDLINGARIRLYGAESADSLRGLYFDGVILDEVADMSPRVWSEIIRPALSDRQGWAAFVGTPKGRNMFWELYDRAETDPSWFRLMLRASETGILPASELDAARQDMTEEQFEQEYECSFEAAIMGAYYGRAMAEAEREGRVDRVPWEPTLPVHTAWDLGISDQTSIWFAQFVRHELRVIDYYAANGHGLDHYAKVLREKPYIYGDHFVPHDARVTELGTGKSRLEVMNSLGLRPRIAPELSVEDGINAVRVTLNKCWFDRQRCHEGIEALKQYRADWDEQKQTFRDRPRHDWASHPADAFRYLCLSYRERTGSNVRAFDPRKPETITFADAIAAHDRLRRTQRYTRA